MRRSGAGGRRLASERRPARCAGCPADRQFRGLRSGSARLPVGRGHVRSVGNHRPRRPPHADPGRLSPGTGDHRGLRPHRAVRTSRRHTVESPFRAERDSRADTAAGGRPHFVHHLHVGDDRCPQGRADPRRGLPHRGRSVRGRRGTDCGRPRTVRVARALRRIFLRGLPPARARRAPRHPRPGGPAVPAQVLLGRRRRGDHGDQLLAELPSVASVQRAPGPVGRYAAASDGPRRRSAVHRRHQSGVDRQPGTTGGEPVRADRGDDRRRSSEPDAGAARGRPGADRPAASRQLVPPGRRARTPGGRTRGGRRAVHRRRAADGRIL